jgi:hypothetical protein
MQSVPLDIEVALNPIANHLSAGPESLSVTVDVAEFISTCKDIELPNVSTPDDFVCAIETFSPTNKAIAK